MRLGLCTACFGDVTLPEVLRWAGRAGFEAVDLPAPPLRSTSSWHHGAALAVAGLDGPGRDAFAAALDDAGLVAACLASDVPLLDADADRAERARGHLLQTVEAAGLLGIGVVRLPVDRSGAAPPGEAIAEFARRIGPVLEAAAGAGVRLAVDTDPRLGRDLDDVPAGAAFCPELWEKLFTHVRSEWLGLALDPGPLLWQGIDPVTALTDYAEKVFHVRARDAETMDLRRQDCGILRPGGGWWRYRLPGLGQVDWGRLIDRARELGVAAALAIDHADPTYRATLDDIKAGLALSRRLLVQFVP
ncbi:MAG: sugar phosphate isomerase/epimerase [Planctomycetes bacterium]|nr:sugar phosphate isomerase/epimerase [Planctomycetota bacterium]